MIDDPGGAGVMDLYEGTFEHSGTGRDVAIWLERDVHHIGPSQLLLSVNGAQILSAVDTVRGGHELWTDIETLKYHLIMVQDVINNRITGLMKKEKGS